MILPECGFAQSIGTAFSDSVPSRFLEEMQFPTAHRRFAGGGIVTVQFTGGRENAGAVGKGKLVEVVAEATLRSEAGRRTLF